MRKQPSKTGPRIEMKQDWPRKITRIGRKGDWIKVEVIVDGYAYDIYKSLKKTGWEVSQMSEVTHLDDGDAVTVKLICWTNKDNLINLTAQPANYGNGVDIMLDGNKAIGKIALLRTEFVGLSNQGENGGLVASFATATRGTYDFQYIRLTFTDNQRQLVKNLKNRGDCYYEVKFIITGSYSKCIYGDLISAQQTY